MFQKSALIAIVSLICAQDSLASTLNSVGTPSSSLFESVGKTITGQFNIASLLANPSDQYLMSSGYLSFSFLGGSDTTFVNSSTVYGGQAGGGSSALYTIYTNTSNYNDSLDSVTVTFGSSNESANDSASAYSNTVITGLSEFQTGTHPYEYSYNVPYHYNCGIFGDICFGWDTYNISDNIPDYDTTTYLTNTNGYSGLFNLNANLSSTDLASLATNGILNYAITINSGNVALQDANLSFDAVPTPVPIPGTIWLFGSALISLVSVGRSKTLVKRM